MPALVVAAYLSLFILGLMDNARGPFFPEIMTDFSVNSTKGSFFFATTSLFAFFGSLIAGRLLKTWSSIQLLIVASMGFSLGFVAIALSPSWPVLCASCALFGLAFGGLNVSQNTVVLESAPPYLRRRMLNGLHSMYALAALIAPIAATAFRLTGAGWRMTFLVLAVLPWILLFGIGQFVRRAPDERTTETHIPLYMSEWREVWLYSLMTAGYLWAEISVSTRIVLWLRADLAYDPNLANFMMSCFFATFLLGRLAFSLVHFPNLSNWDVMLRSSILSVLLMAAGLYFHPFFMVLSGLTMAPFYPVAMDQVNSHFGEKAGQALGFIIGFGSLSVVIMHVTIGWATDHWGLTHSLWICAGGLLIVALGLIVRSRRVAR